MNYNSKTAFKSALNLKVSKIVDLSVVLVFFWFFLIPFNIYSQCTDGSENACSCETADILCTIDELDGYTFETVSYTHLTLPTICSV